MAVFNPLPYLKNELQITLKCQFTLPNDTNMVVRKCLTDFWVNKAFGGSYGSKKFKFQVKNGGQNEALTKIATTAPNQ